MWSDTNTRTRHVASEQLFEAITLRQHKITEVRGADQQLFQLAIRLYHMQ